MSPLQIGLPEIDPLGPLELLELLELINNTGLSVIYSRYFVGIAAWFSRCGNVRGLRRASALRDL